MLNIYVDTMNPLLESCAYKKIDEVKAAIQSGANINQTDMYGCTPLLFVCNNGCLPIIKLLFANKANVNQTAFDGRTPLMAAATHYPTVNPDGVIETLLTNGANIDQFDIHHNTPLIHATMLCNANGVKQLLANKANALITNIYGNTALTIAARMGYKDIKNILRNHVYSILVETGLTVLPRDILREI